MAQQNDKQKQLLTEVMNADEKDGLYKQQTAVEWFYRELKALHEAAYDTDEAIDILYEQAKQMEKEQLHKCASFWRGKENEIEKPIFNEYYNETYGK